MKKALDITATLYDPDLLKNLVEKLASKHVDKGYHQITTPEEWEPFESSCTIAYVMGNFDMSTMISGEEVNMPFTTQFMFTCIKTKYSLFNLEWSSSLS
jgi:hypothetical protein